MGDMKKKRKSQWLSNIILVLCLIVFSVSLWKLAGYYMEYKAGEGIYEEINEAVTFPEDEKEEENTENGEVKKTEAKPPKVDSEKLMEQNPDYAGWLYVADTSISYPVAAGDDNQKYLKYTFTGERNGCGCIFIDMDNEKDFSSRHTVIHGHNMKNGSMFGTLRSFSKKTYWEDHPYIYIVTPEKTLKYEIFSSCRVESDSGLYENVFDSDEEFLEFLALCEESKGYETGINPGADDKILTLSTCTSDTETGRRLVQARLVSEETDNEE